MPRTKDDWVMVGGIAAGVCSFLLMAVAILSLPVAH